MGSIICTQLGKNILHTSLDRLFGDRQFRGNLFVGALAGELLARLELDGEKVIKEERLLQGLRERIRDVRQGPDGALWLATDNGAGRILRVVPGRR